MWPKIKTTFISIFNFSSASLQIFLGLCWNLPKTLRALWLSDPSRHFLKQSFLINGVYFAFPLLVGRALVQDLLQDQEKEEERALLNNFLSTFYFIFMFRLKILNFALHNLGIIFSVSWLRPSLDRFSLAYEAACKQCKVDGSRLVSELALIKHYFMGELVISLLSKLLQRIPGGVFFGLTLQGYWKGFILFQYPLASKKICADHQISLLSAHRSQLVGFGLFALGLEEGTRRLLIFVMPELVSQQILKTALYQVLSGFEMLLAYEKSPWIKHENSKALDKEEARNLIDPVLLTWHGARYSTGYLFKTLNRQRSKSAPSLSSVLDHRIKQASDLRTKLVQSPLQPLFSMGQRLLVPKALLSFQDFISLKAAQPLICLFFEELQPLLNVLEQMNENLWVKSCCRLLSFPLFGTLCLSVAARYTHSKTGLNEKWIKDLGHLLQSTKFQDQLKVLHIYLRWYQLRSQAILQSCKPNSADYEKILSFSEAYQQYSFFSSSLANTFERVEYEPIEKSFLAIPQKENEDECQVKNEDECQVKEDECLGFEEVLADLSSETERVESEWENISASPREHRDEDWEFIDEMAFK